MPRKNDRMAGDGLGYFGGRDDRGQRLGSLMNIVNTSTNCLIKAYEWDGC
jgi:hypothetical protein